MGLIPAVSRSTGSFSAEAGCLAHAVPSEPAGSAAGIFGMGAETAPGRKHWINSICNLARAGVEGGIVQALQTEICCSSLRHLPTAANAGLFACWNYVTSSPSQLLPIFFMLDPMPRSITWKSSIKIWAAASELHERCWCNVLARKWSLLVFHWKWLASGGRGRWLQLAVTVWPGKERKKPHPPNYIPVKLLTLH